MSIQFKNFIYLSCVLLIHLVLPLIYLPYVIRVLGVDSFGIVIWIQSVIQYFLIFIEGGWNWIAIRNVSIYQESPLEQSKHMAALLWIRGGCLIISVVILTIFLTSVSLRGNLWIYIFSAISLISPVLSQTYYFQGVEKTKYILYSMIPSLLLPIAVFIFVRSHQDGEVYALVMSLAVIANSLMSLWMVRRHFLAGIFPPDLTSIKNIFSEGGLLMIAQLLITGITYSRIIIVGWVSPQEILGQYVAAEKIIGLILTFPLVIIIQANFPKICRLAHSSFEESFQLSQDIQKRTTWIYLLICASAYLFSELLMRYLLPGSYDIGLTSFRLLLLAALLTAFHSIDLYFFIACGAIRAYFLICLFCGIGGFILMTFLGFKFGYLGVSCGIVVISAMSFLMTKQQFKLILKQHSKNFL